MKTQVQRCQGSGLVGADSVTFVPKVSWKLSASLHGVATEAPLVRTTTFPPFGPRKRLESGQTFTDDPVAWIKCCLDIKYKMGGMGNVVFKQ